jgi:hypothetical protein
VTDFPAIKAILDGHDTEALRGVAWAEYEDARRWKRQAAGYCGKAHQLQADLETERYAANHTPD